MNKTRLSRHEKASCGCNSDDHQTVGMRSSCREPAPDGPAAFSIAMLSDQTKSAAAALKNSRTYPDQPAADMQFGAPICVPLLTD